MDFLKGKKTFIVAIAGGIATVAVMLGFIDMDTYGVIMGALGVTGAATLRMGMKT